MTDDLTSPTNGISAATDDNDDDNECRNNVHGNETTNGHNDIGTNSDSGGDQVEAVDQETLELSKLRCTSLQTEEIAKRKRERDER